MPYALFQKMLMSNFKIEQGKGKGINSLKILYFVSILKSIYIFYPLKALRYKLRNKIKDVIGGIFNCRCFSLSISTLFFLHSIASTSQQNLPKHEAFSLFCWESHRHLLLNVLCNPPSSCIYPDLSEQYWAIKVELCQSRWTVKHISREQTLGLWMCVQTNRL